MKYLSKLSLIVLALLCIPLLVNAQFIGEVTVGIDGDFSTLKEFADSLNAVGMSGNTTVKILSDIEETSSVSINQWEEFGEEGYFLTIKPDGGNRTIQGSFTTSAVIILNGASRVIIDGEFNEGERNLTIMNTATSGSSNKNATIWIKSLGVTENCNNITIKNTIIYGADGTQSAIYRFGIFSGGATIDNSGSLGKNDNVTIQNNHIKRAHYGIYVQGQTEYLVNLKIIKNEIGSNLESEYVRFEGIHIANATNSLISQNNIYNIRMTTGSGATHVKGIELNGSCDNITVEKNLIHGISQSSSSGQGALGINIGTYSGISNITIYNNVIYDITTINYSTTQLAKNPFGIRIAKGINIKVWFNSINLYGTQAPIGSSGTLSAAFLVSDANNVSGLDIRNNVFSNSLEGLSGTRSYAICIMGSSSSFIDIDYNDYYAGGTYGILGNIGTSFSASNDKITIEEWKTGTGFDNNSISADPQFTTNDNLIQFPNSPLILAGYYFPDLPYDFFGNLRLNPPSIGAYDVNPGAFLPPPLLKSPANFAVGIPTLTQFDWSAIEGISSYFIQISSGIDFSEIIEEGLVDNDSSYIVENQLFATTQYFWRVRCEDDEDTCCWSQIRQFITQGPLEQPLLLSPQSGSTELPVNVALEWSEIFGANQYNIQISTNDEFTELVADEFIYNTSYIPSLNLLTEYWWRVSATNGINISSWSDIWTFTTNSVVTIGSGTTYIPPLLTFPAPYGRANSGARHQILITAEEIIAAGGEAGFITSLSFDVYNINSCDAMLDFSIKMKHTDQTTLTTFEYDNWTTCFVAEEYQPVAGWNTHIFDYPFTWDGVSNILVETCFNNYPMGRTSNASHYYTQTATNSIGYYRSNSDTNVCANPSVTATYSKNRVNMKFTMDLSNVFPPQLVAPTNNSLFNPILPLFDWDDVENAYYYTLQIATDEYFNNLELEQIGIIQSSYQLTLENALNESSLYYWRVSASDASGSSSLWSQIWCFTTIGNLPPVTLLTPADSAIRVLLEPTFTWQALIGAELYEFQLSTNYDFSNIIFSSQDLSATNITLPPEYTLDNHSQYFWRVKGYTEEYTGEWSNIWIFTTITMVNLNTYIFFAEDEDYIEINDGTNTGLYTNGPSSIYLDLPFTFVYANEEFNSVTISINGWVGLGNILHNSSSNDLSSTSYVRLLAPLWDNLALRSDNINAEISYKTEGETPNQVFIVQFKNLYISNTYPFKDALNFQVRIYEANGIITFNYGDMYVIYATTGNCNSSIGMSGLVGGSNDFISINPGTTITASSTNAYNSINPEQLMTLSNKKFTFMPAGNYVNLLNPANDSLTETDVTLQWEAIEEADYYNLLVSTSNNFQNIIINEQNIESTSYLLENLDDFVTYFWKVQAQIDGENTCWSKYWTFTTTSDNLYAPVLLYPFDEISGIQSNVQFDWKSVLTASGYQIQVANDILFNDILIDQTTNETNFSYEFEMNSSFFWRVRALNSASTSPWSNIWTFSTGSSFFQIGDGTSSNTFKTYPAPYGNSYWGAKHQILVLAEEMIAAGFSAGDITSLSFNVSEINSTEPLTFFDIKIGQTTVTSLSDVWEETNMTQVFFALSLKNILGWNTHNFSTPFAWDGVSNILVDVCFNNESFSFNQNTYYSTTSFNSVRYFYEDYSNICYSPGAPSLSTNRPNLMFGGPIEPLPPPPSLATPVNGSNGISINPLFVWSNVNQASEYKIQISDNPDFNNPIISEQTAEAQYQLQSNLNYLTQYWWRVRSITSFGTMGLWSSAWSFTTQPYIPWEYTETGNYSTIIVQTSINPMLGDRPIANDDAIGLFYQREEGDWYCGGYAIWNGENLGITVWGDNPDTPIKDGFLIGEPYTFKIWDNVTRNELDAIATYQIGNDYYTVSGVSNLSSLNAYIITNQNISLNSGWNIISSFIEPENDTITSIFVNIATDVKIVKNAAGQMYDPAFNINTIGNWNFAEGYLVNMLNNNELTISGQKLVPEVTPLNLNNGWNLSAYLRDNDIAPTAALESISSSLVLAKNNVGGIFSPVYGINTLGNMQAGQGYYFYMNAAAELTYPANSAQKAVAGDEMTPLAKYNIPTMKNTGKNATLLISIESNDGNEIGVYSMNNELIGSGAVYNGIAAITIWGDDEATQNIDGAKENEYLNVKLYNISNNTNKEISLTQIKEITGNTEQSELYYRTNAIFVAKASATDESGFAMSIKNIPNPVESNVVFEFTLTDEANAEIQIYTSTGELVASIENGNYSAGLHRINFDASNLSNGVFNIVLTSGSKKVSSFMIVDK